MAQLGLCCVILCGQPGCSIPKQSLACGAHGVPSLLGHIWLQLPVAAAGEPPVFFHQTIWDALLELREWGEPQHDNCPCVLSYVKSVVYSCVIPWKVSAQLTLWDFLPASEQLLWFLQQHRSWEFSFATLQSHLHTHCTPAPQVFKLLPASPC